MFRMKVAVVTVVCLAALVPAALGAGENRATTTEKGSLLIYPKVELRFSTGGNLIQDTFITINNDQNQLVNLHMFFVSELCTFIDNEIVLTRNEPAYWSVATGLPKGVSPFDVLGAPIPDPEGTGDLVLRGYIVAWAVDGNDLEIQWDHLYGGATIVNYEEGDAWEYNAYAFQRLSAAVGDGTLRLGPLSNGEYDSVFSTLLLDFFACGSQAFSGGGRTVYNDTDLTLLIVRQDFSHNPDPTVPETTLAKFDIWNANEVGYSNTKYCITKWDERLLSCLAAPNHFNVQYLQTDKGHARITGQANSACNITDPNSPVVSVAAPMLGVAARVLCFDGSETATAGTTLGGWGQNTSAVTIVYTPLAGAGTKSLSPIAAQETVTKARAVMAD